MKKVEKKKTEEMLPEYELRGGARGKYAKRYAQGTNIVLLDPDVAAVFKGSKKVNQALRELMEATRTQRPGRTTRKKIGR